jgi:hypothetical protein
MGEEASRAAALPPGKLTPALDEAVGAYLAATESAPPAKGVSQATDDKLPTVGGWVATLGSDGEFPRVAKVRDAYRDSEGELLLDLVMYSHDGTKLGRTSPAMGGPRGYEPCCCGEWWVEIEQPPFAQMAETRFGYRHLLVPRSR